MIKKMYLAKYSKGSYDDYEEVIVYASFDKEKVELWAKRLNDIVERYSIFYKKFENKHGWFDDNLMSSGNCYSWRWYVLRDFNEAYCHSVDVRQ